MQRTRRNTESDESETGNGFNGGCACRDPRCARRCRARRPDNIGNGREVGYRDQVRADGRGQ
jgi:hypothetical protein